MQVPQSGQFEGKGMGNHYHYTHAVRISRLKCLQSKWTSKRLDLIAQMRFSCCFQMANSVVETRRFFFSESRTPGYHPIPSWKGPQTQSGQTGSTDSCEKSNWKRCKFWAFLLFCFSLYTLENFIATTVSATFTSLHFLLYAEPRNIFGNWSCSLSARKTKRGVDIWQKDLEETEIRKTWELLTLSTISWTIPWFPSNFRCAFHRVFLRIASCKSGGNGSAASAIPSQTGEND